MMKNLAVALLVGFFYFGCAPYGEGESSPSPVADSDGDGYTEEQGDCDDTNVTVYPGAEEVCDGVQNDCTPIEDGLLAGEADADKDGFVSCIHSDNLQIGDCDDRDSDVYPGAPEIVDGKDNDCDGEIDEVDLLVDEEDLIE